MVWHFTDDVAAYARHTTDLLAADPARDTVALTVLAAVRAGRRWSPEPVVFGWSESGGHVSGAVCMNPPYELLLAAVDVSDAAPLVDGRREHRRRGFGAPVTAACTADALTRGAHAVELFTDLADPTANAIYRQIGYRSLQDHLVVVFTAD